jgi:Uma2 family endonuclease
MATMTEAPTASLTYEAYMAELEVQGRYDIVNGVRIIMPEATWEHQNIVGNLIELLRGYGRAKNVGKALSTSFYVLIRRIPKLQTPQPDVLFISFARLTTAGGISAKGPLQAAPELVIEIISDSETQRILDDKLADYRTIGVSERWVIRPEAQTVEVLALTQHFVQSTAVYREDEAVVSDAFPDLALPITSIFAA